jgi:plastocyanin
LRITPLLLLISAVMFAPVATKAGTIEFRLIDADGRAISDAVVTLVPPNPIASPSAASAEPLIVDQSSETFIPYVVVVPRGASVVFRNSDDTRHHVYSFSPPKPFELVVVPGETSAPVRFDSTGIVVLGCNIHDHMIAYLYVSDAGLIGRTGADGTISLASVPAGAYVAHVWHPRQRPGRPEFTQPVDITAADQTVTLSLSLMPKMPGMQMQTRDRERSRY